MTTESPSGERPGGRRPVTTVDAQQRPVRWPGVHELTSLEERLGLLLVVRIGLVVVVLVAAAAAPGEAGVTAAQVGPLSAGYLLLGIAVEGYRRRAVRGRLLVSQAMLPADAIYLALVTTPAGGPRSQLVVLFAVHLIAVTLLASQRTGIRIALWDSVLFVVIPALSLSSSIGSMLGVDAVVVPTASETALAILGFWVVALCTAFFSSVSERELRGSKAELSALAEMASALEGVRSDEDILAILLRTTVRAFGFRRGALWWPHGEQGSALTLSGQPSAEVVLRDLPAGGPDQVAEEAWQHRDAVLVRRLDPVADPQATALLPGAVNVVVLPLPTDGDSTGVLLLEHGGHPFTARLPRRTLVMLAQFTAHTALALRNARLLTERERMAAMDGLTGLANRREFDKTLAREVSRAERSGEPLSLAVLDVDHFKAINDSRGHLAGDEVLRQIGRVLGSAVRDMDLVARYGGEEFAIVLPRCSQADAVRVVQRVSAAARSAPGLEGVTLSSGVATLPDHASDGRSLVEAADEALYCSKRDGRDRLTVSNRS